MSKDKSRANTCKRRTWFVCVKAILRIFIKKPKYVFLGEEFESRALILSNHVGAKGPLAIELYHPHGFRFWGTYEMNMGIVEVYKYLSVIYFHNKKHINKTLSKIIAFVACPFLWIYYRGLKLIPTYSDYRLKKTIEQSFATIKEGGSIVIFPENSSDGYHDKLTQFYAGFATFANYCLKHGIDLPVYLTYLKKKPRVFVVDKPFMWSTVSHLSKKQISEMLLKRCNELGDMEI